MTLDAGTLALFDAVVTAERPLLVRAAARIVGPLWAEDSAQTGLLNAWRALPRFEGGPRDMAAWLLAITCNASRDWLRAQHARPQTAPIGEPDANAEDGPGWWSRLVDDETPEAAALRQEAVAEARIRVAPLLAALSPRSRQALWETVGLGRTQGAVAAAHGTTWQAVKALRERALLRCRDVAAKKERA